MSEACMGYDPGVTGCIAVATDVGPMYVGAIKNDMTEKEVLAVVRPAIEMLRAYDGNTCFVERVQHMTGDGGKGSFTFGGIYKLVRGMLLMADVDLKGVYPQTWQAKMGCMTGGRKVISTRRANKLFPNMRFTENTADGTLIAEYGRLQLLRRSSP